LHCPIVDTDRTRKQLLGSAEEQAHPDAPFTGAYTPELTNRVYTEVLRRAAVVLASGRPVVLDGSFGMPEQRRQARSLAERFGVRFHFVQCTASREETMERLARREQGPHVSDGRRDI